MKQTIKKCALFALFASLFGAGLVAATGNIPPKAKIVRQLKSFSLTSQSKQFDKSN